MLFDTNDSLVGPNESKNPAEAPAFLKMMDHLNNLTAAITTLSSDFEKFKKTSVPAIGEFGAKPPTADQPSAMNITGKKRSFSVSGTLGNNTYTNTLQHTQKNVIVNLTSLDSASPSSTSIKSSTLSANNIATDITPT